MLIQPEVNPPALQPLPDPLKQPWEWAVALASGDERALAIQRQRQREAIELLKQRNEVSRANPSPDDDWDILAELNKTASWQVARHFSRQMRKGMARSEVHSP